MSGKIPVVNYLVLDGGDPHIVAQECTSCGALWLGEKFGCGKCGKREFRERRLSNDGKLRSFTIVHRGSPGVPVPFVSAVVELEGGGFVKANLLDVEPKADGIKLGMALRMKTFAAGTDDEGTEAIAFGYAPA